MMQNQVYEFRLNADVPVEEARDTLRLAVLAAEAVHGESDVSIDTAHHIDANSRVCRIDGATRVGRDLARLFSRFLAREFGPEAYHVRRTDRPCSATV